MHQLTRALARHRGSDEITIVSSSWRDRPATADIAELDGVRVVDRRVPVRVLNFAWHRLGWPPAEVLAGGPCDVAHSPHPLLMPARAAAQVLTIHDLDFIAHPERTRREVRRDYPALVRAHAHRADRIIVPSHYTAGQVCALLKVPLERIAICPHGAPDWATGAPLRQGNLQEGYILFVGTLEPRKNVGALVRAYRSLASRRGDVPRLVLAGRATAPAAPWLDAHGSLPAGTVEHIEYVPPGDRARLYQRALMLVLPSFDEGFGLPALEAMAAGVPVIVSTRGALPEVVGDAGVLVEPEDVDGLETAIDRLLSDTAHAEGLAARGLARAGMFSWQASAEAHRRAYEEAIAARRARRGVGAAQARPT